MRIYANILNGGHMKEIKRNIYLNRLIDRKENGLIKVITGIRRCGKSYLLDPIFKNYLLSIGIDENHIIKIDLESNKNKGLHDPEELTKYVEDKIKDDKTYYLLLDEVQHVLNFEGVLNGFLHIRNLDIYVTGSNSKFLSSDIITEFRGRGDEVRVFPLSFSEFASSFNGDKYEAWNEYLLYGGMPYILSMKNVEQKSQYLKGLFNNTYINDIIEKNRLQKTEELETIINILSSSIGSLTNPLKIAKTFESNGIKGISPNTIGTYIHYLLDAFLISKAERYDIKGKKYISTPSKYYFVDTGLRNARLNFRQIEETHLMENIIYNELLMRGYNVDVGMVEYNTKDTNGKSIRKQLEVDFVCNLGNKRYYIQSAFAIPDLEKMKQESNSLVRIDDSFKKYIIVASNTPLWRTEDGITIMNVQEFLLNPNSLDL